MGEIVITGAAGFIGSVLIKALNKKGINQIMCFDELGTSDKWKNLLGKEFLDIIHYNKLFQYINQFNNKIDVVVHLGACSSTIENNMDYLLDNNYRFSQKLYNLCYEKGIRLIWASSAATYGDGTHGFSDDNLDLFPLNKYGLSKHLFDLWQDKEMNKPKQYVGLKFFNVYGPNEYHKKGMYSAILTFYLQAVSEGYIEIYGDGKQERDFIYVEDVVDIILFFIQNGGINGIFNVGTGTSTKFCDIASMIFKELNMKKNIIYSPLPDNLQTAYQFYTRADINKLYNFQYANAITTVEEGIKKYLNEYLLSGCYL